MNQRLRTLLPAIFILALGLFLLLPASPAPAEEEPAEEKKADEEAEESPLTVCEDAEAKKLAAEIKKISKKKNATLVLPVLEKIDELSHPEFDKPLLKLLKHKSSLVAVRAAEMWEWRVTKKNASKLWKATWMEKKNDKRYPVKAIALKGFARASIKLTDKQFKEIERAWRWIVGNPNPTMAPALVAISEYVELSKDKRLSRKLAEELDEPIATNPNSPSNPPADWWERRWKLWKESKSAIVSALKALTGQEFDKTAEAKAWFEANKKTYKFKW